MTDTEGILVVRLNPLLRQYYSTFMRNFQKNQHKLSNHQVQFSNPPPPHCKFEPPSKKSWIRPYFYYLFYLHGPAHMGPIWNPIALPIWIHITGPRSAVGNVSGYRCVSDCRSRGREFDPGPVPYFRGDWSWNNFYGHSPPFKKGCCQLQAKVCARITG